MREIKINNINNWQDFFMIEQKKKYFINMMKILENEYKNNIIFPLKSNIYKAYELTPLDKVKVVLLGQDPFINKYQAHGLSFSIENNLSKIPPTLKNIFLELNRDLNINRTNYNLEDWSKQGIFLLNTILTVRKGKSLSHSNIGWEKFTDNTIDILNKLDRKIIFVLLGKKAQLKKKNISVHHIILETSHPSPFSFKKGFYGSGIFSKINKILLKNKYLPIKW